MTAPSLRQQIADQLGLPLRIRARALAEGMTTGLHRAVTKGSGIEFAGHRAYTPGDDLRHLDRHARLRHNRLLVRQFHTDTERAIHLLVDVSPSMAYADQGAPSKSKLDLALLLAGALAYAASKAGDEVGLTLVDPTGARTSSGRHGASLDRVLSLLEGAQQHGGPPTPKQRSPRVFSTRSSSEETWQRMLEHLGGTMPRGSILFVLSDFLDFTPGLVRSSLQMTTRGRSVRAAQILTRSEISFPFEGPILFRDPETDLVVQTDGERARSQYLVALAALTGPLEVQLNQLGGTFVRLPTDIPPQRALVSLVRGAPFEQD